MWSFDLRKRSHARLALGVWCECHQRSRLHKESLHVDKTSSWLELLLHPWCANRKFLAGWADLNRCTRKWCPKPLKKARGVANLQSSQKILIFRTCKTKLGCVLEEGENANSNDNCKNDFILLSMDLAEHTVLY